jgi:putative RNA 2'-phosphotransferase
MAGILRHFPDKYGVTLDSEGWAKIDDLVRALRAAGYPWVEKWHVRAIAELDPKGRYEVMGDKIRARYGHSVKVKVEPLSYEAPPTLFHGTIEENLPSIRAKGILPMRRLKVHLSASIEDAVETARRHGPRVVVLEIDVECVERSGYTVARASKTVYVADYIPPECIKKVHRVHAYRREG